MPALLEVKADFAQLQRIANLIGAAGAGATLTGAGGQGTIEKVVVAKSGANAATLRLHLFSAAPATTSGDGAQIAVTLDLTTYIGSLDVQMDDVINGGRVGVTVLPLPYILAAGDTIYALVEAYSAWTPVSGETLAVRLFLRPSA